MRSRYNYGENYSQAPAASYIRAGIPAGLRMPGLVQGEGALVGSRVRGGGAVEESGSLMAGSRKLCAHISAGRFMKVLFF